MNEKSGFKSLGELQNRVRMQQVELELTLAEVNQILDALSDKSYKQVYQLIIKIQQQAENQLQKNDQRQLQPEN